MKVLHSIYQFKKIRRVLWWLSVDNYLHCLASFIDNFTNFVLTEKPLQKFFYFDDRDGNIEHWVQSEYARQFIELNGIHKDHIYLVEDYMNQAFLKRSKSIDFSKKENIVAFNPKKGIETTKVIISQAPDIDWRPIQNMTPDQVQELLAKCKVYIDFGNHPGKDRIPREAALAGCVIITGKRGSAANDIDINIPTEFKFDEKVTSPFSIIKKIREIFVNFEENFHKQRSYRDKILDDKSRFSMEVAKAFSLQNIFNLPQIVAIANGINDNNLHFANFLFKTENKFLPLFIIDDNFSKDSRQDNLKYIRREGNSSYIYFDNKKRLEIISSEDAKFLYLEGRIKKFALFSQNDKEVKDFEENFQLKSEDIIIAKIAE